MQIARHILARTVWPVAVFMVLLGVVAYPQESLKKVTRSEAMAAVASKVQPEYPRMAKQLRMQGTVELEANVSESGDVTKVQIVSGNPVFTAPAAEALKQWKFKPFMEGGKAVPVLAPVSLDFKL